ncbi:hypothetical protein ACFYVR_12190 [Rhodococcus sp. NPDC003318]|uniref:hypothetical protein n=1 Tax=Rhodococcus sp. NPDC003318 TaxID=3364503 RepID=UPI0036CC6150
MTTGLGLSIRTATATAAVRFHDATTLSSYRSTLTFEDSSTVRLGDHPGPGVIAGFADRVDDILVAGDGHHYTGRDLVAAAAHCLIAAANVPPGSAMVLTYPAVHSPRTVDLLRSALDRAGLPGVGLVAEPVAAVAWLESEHGPLGDGLALVCDVGAGSLDLTVVAVGAVGGPDPILGRSLRSAGFGAVPAAGHEAAPVLDLVDECLAVAGVARGDLDVVVLTGAASAGFEDVLARLRRPVVLDHDPGSVTARGAATLAAVPRTTSTVTASGNRRPRRVALAAAATVAVAALAAVPLLVHDTGSTDTTADGPADTRTVRVVERLEPPHLPSGRALPGNADSTSTPQFRTPMPAASEPVRHTRVPDVASPATVPAPMPSAAPHVVTVGVPDIAVVASATWPAFDTGTVPDEAAVPTPAQSTTPTGPTAEPTTASAPETPTTSAPPPEPTPAEEAAVLGDPPHEPDPSDVDGAQP